MPLRAARRNERLQIAASSLGQGLDANGEKNPSARAAFKRARRRQSRSFFPSHRQHQLSAYGRHVHHLAPRHDRPLLPGLVPGPRNRPASVPGLHLFHIVLLSRRRTRALPQNLEAHLSLSSVCNGRWHRPFCSQCLGSSRSPLQREIRIRAHPKIPRRSQRNWKWQLRLVQRKPTAKAPA